VRHCGGASGPETAPGASEPGHGGAGARPIRVSAQTGLAGRRRGCCAAVVCQGGAWAPPAGARVGTRRLSGARRLRCLGRAGSGLSPHPVRRWPLRSSTPIRFSSGSGLGSS